MEGIIMDHRNRAKLIDVPERRSLAEPLELREARDGSGNLVLEGYASTWDEYDCYGGPQAGGWVEQIDRLGVDRTLAERPDVMLLVNHEGLPLARTAHGGHPGTMTLQALKRGLFTSANLNPKDPDVMQIAPKLLRHDLDEMSFAFRVKDQVWNNNYDHRLITEMSLQKGDVSVVNYGMNPNTHVEIMDTIAQLSQLSNKELLEVRKLDRSVLRHAAHTLLTAAESSGAVKPDQRSTSAFAGGGSFVNFDGSHLLYEGTCVTCQGARSRGPDNTPYADPGFLDGVQRLPVDALHVKASWQYFGQPKNQIGYSSEQVAQIRGSIQTAMTMHGHDVGEEKGMSEPEISHIESVRKLGGGVSLVAVMTDGSRTPLPSFRQSGELVGAGAGDGGVFGAVRTDPKPTDDTDDQSDTSERAGKPPWLKPGGSKDDPEDDPAQGGDGGKDDADENPDGSKKKPEKKSGDGMNPEEDARANGHPADCACTACQDSDRDMRSASERLAELRNKEELPDRPTIDEALGYLKRMQ